MKQAKIRLKERVEGTHTEASHAIAWIHDLQSWVCTLCVNMANTRKDPKNGKTRRMIARELTHPSHKLYRASFENDSTLSLLACHECGAYLQHRCVDQRKKCPGHPGPRTTFQKRVKSAKHPAKPKLMLAEPLKVIHLSVLPRLWPRILMRHECTRHPVARCLITSLCESGDFSSDTRCVHTYGPGPLATPPGLEPGDFWVDEEEESLWLAGFGFDDPF